MYSTTRLCLVKTVYKSVVPASSCKGVFMEKRAFMIMLLAIFTLCYTTGCVKSTSESVSVIQENQEENSIIEDTSVAETASSGKNHLSENENDLEFVFNNNGLKIAFPSSWETYETTDGCYSCFHDIDYVGILYANFAYASSFENCNGEKIKIGKYEYKYENDYYEAANDSNACTYTMYTELTKECCLEVRWVLRNTNNEEQIKGFLSSNTCTKLMESIELDPDEFEIPSKLTVDESKLTTIETSVTTTNALTTATESIMENEEDFDQFIADQVYQKIMLLDEGTETSISDIVRELYKENDYGVEQDNVDLWAVMDIVEEKLDGKRVLDFSKWNGIMAGLPYNLPFVIRNADYKLEIPVHLD